MSASARIGTVVWITGLPSSGKSTLAKRVHAMLVEHDTPCCVLDGDEVRAALDPAPGYNHEARAAFYRTLANLAALIAHQGLVVLVPATANRRIFREGARRMAPQMIEVFVDVPLATCVERDAKGLYARARRGDTTSMPGAGAGYEAPTSPDVVARGGEDLAACAAISRLAIQQAGERPFTVRNATMTVGDVMTPIPLTVEPSLPLHKALRVMRDNDIRHLLVVGGHHKLVGMLSERDLQRHMGRALETRLETPSDRLAMLAPVEQIMTPDPYTADASQALKEVVDLMHEGRFGAVPVVDEQGRPTGILSSVDLLRALSARL